MKKKLKKFAIISVILFLAALTLFILWTTWENWSGAREWEKVRTTLVDNDVELDLGKLVPPTPPEKDNFCAAPIIAPLLDYEWPVEEAGLSDINEGESVVYSNPEGRKRLLALKLPELESGSASPNFSTATHADLKSVRDALAKIDSSSPSILEWMKQFEAELTELDAAAKRPEATMPFPISEDFLTNVSMPVPAFQEFRDLTEFQTIRACAALEAGDNAQAIAALEGMFKIHQATATHPTLLGFLVSKVSLDSCLSVVWQGMAHEQWSADDLLWIQSRLQEVDLMPDLERALNFEMVSLQIGVSEFLKNISLGQSMEVAGMIEPIASPASGVSSPLGLLALVTPSGIWDHNKAFGCRMMFDYGILPVRERKFPDAAAFNEELKDRSRRRFVAALALPATSNLIRNAYHGAVSVDLARVACAVERHRLAGGDYCESLDALVPTYLDKIPADFVESESPLRYGKGLHGDRYRIYSVGQNLIDDGGEVIFLDRPGQSTKLDLAPGDWAWGYTFEKPNAEAE